MHKHKSSTVVVTCYPEQVDDVVNIFIKRGYSSKEVMISKDYANICHVSVTRRV